MTEKEHSQGEEKSRQSYLKIPKRGLWIVLGIIVAIAMIVGVVRAHIYRTIWGFIVPVSANFTVVDSGTSNPIDGASITINGMKLITDKVGKADVYRLWVGSIPITVEAPGYVAVSETIKFHKGANVIEKKLVKDIRTVTFNGKVTDYVSESSLSGVEIKMGTETTKSTDNGTFSFANVPVGDVSLVLNKDGYRENQKTIVLADDSVQTVPMTPNGSTVFVSNRDGGKRGLYVSDYAGTSVKPLIDRVSGTEDFSPVVQPSGQKVLFQSTRDRVPEGDNSSGYKSVYYLVGIDGKGLKKLEDGYVATSAVWANGGKTILAKGLSDGNHLYLYNVAKGTTDRLTDFVGNPNANYPLQLNATSTELAWVGQNLNMRPVLYTAKIASPLDMVSIAEFTPWDVSYDQLGTNNHLGSYRFSQDGLSIEYDYYISQSNNEHHFKRFAVNSREIFDASQPTSDSYVSYVLSPDGKKRAYTATRDGKNDVFISDLDGSNEKRLTQLGTIQEDMVWDVSGKYLLINSAKVAEAARYVVAVSGGDPKKISDISLDYYGGMGQ